MSGRAEQSGRRGLDLDVLKTLYRHELTMLVRDRRTILIAVLAPLILFPIMIFGMRAVEERDRRDVDETVFRFAVTGEEAAFAAEFVSAAIALPADTAEGIAPATFEWVREGEFDALLQDGEIHLVVEGKGKGRGTGEGDEGTGGVGEGEGVGDGGGAVRDGGVGAASRVDRIGDGELVGSGVPEIVLRYRASSDRSTAAARRMEGRLAAVRAALRDSVLLAGGLPVRPAEIAVLERENVASEEKEGGAHLGLMLMPILVMLLLSGGSIVAVDTIAGEKERGTLEALLTTAARRGEIVAAKQLAVVTVGLAITIINVANLYVYLVAGFVEVPANLAMSVSPAAVGVLLLLFVPLAVLVSSVLLLLSGYSKSYKEYQIYFPALMLLFMLPSAAAVLPGVSLRSLISVVPLANVSVAVREVLTGRYDWPFLFLTFATTAACAYWVASITSRLLSTERLISAAELDRAELLGGPDLFPRRVLRWFAVMWAVILVASLWMGDLGIRGQVFFNLVLVFFGGSLVMLRRYRLDAREALALRMPRPSAWLAVLIGAPAALVVGQGLAQLAGIFFPVPEAMLESFGQFMVDETIPIWQILLYLAIFPGVCEEIAFRGLLLHGLRRRFSPVALALAVGLIFGLFHYSLFRIVPTAYLGIVFTAVVLLTGSIYPAMAWHALNNALALVPAHMGWMSSVEEIPGWAYAVAVLGLAASFTILWRDRTTYPGLRRQRAEAVATRVEVAAR